MAYVPGFQHDVFVSYAHGDDRDWINRFVQQLNRTLDRRLGTRTSVWLDEDDNRKSRDFTREIPDSVRSSAVFLLLPSPTYIRSAYCVDQECRIFAETVEQRRERFAIPDFANEMFALRCPILPVDGNEHWSLFPGLTDIPFFAATGTYVLDSSEFEKSFAVVVGQLVDLLKRMRNHSTPVFLYPPHPAAEAQAAHAAVFAELTAQSYRVLPDRNVNVADQLRDASMSIFLIGKDYDDAADGLTGTAERLGKPWVVWCSPEVGGASPDQLGFRAHLEQVESPTKIYLSSATLPAKLKEEVLAVLKPAGRAVPQAGDKPRVYLVYDQRDAGEQTNAGLISYNFRKEFQFDHYDPAQHTRRLSQSDGVLLVWGNADEDVCSKLFQEVFQTARRKETRGLCVFDPRDTKAEALAALRKTFGEELYVGEQFGRFDPSRLDPFFTPIRRRPPGEQP